MRRALVTGPRVVGVVTADELSFFRHARLYIMEAAFRLLFRLGNGREYNERRKNQCEYFHVLAPRVNVTLSFPEVKKRAGKKTRLRQSRRRRHWTTCARTCEALAHCLSGRI